MPGISKREVEKLIKAKFDEKVKLRKLRTKDLDSLAITIIKEMKSMISKGISPIKGNKRFARYKNPERYPEGVRGSFPKKRKRPVNLTLSGDFLKMLKFKSKTGRKPKIEIGFYDKLSKKKEQGHREGAGGQPKRPIIPKGKGESYAVRIVTEVRRNLLDILDKRFK